MSNPALVSANIRASVGGRVFSINIEGDSVNYRDLTESRTGKFVTEKQKAMLGKVVTAATSAVGKLSLPSEPAAKPAKAAKLSKGAVKGAKGAKSAKVKAAKVKG